MRAAVFMIAILAALSTMGAQTNLTIKAAGLDSDGVILVSPSSPGFDALVRKIMANEATELVLRLKPYLVVVSNQNPRTVVAFAVLWKLTYRDGREENTTVQFKYPDAVAGIPGTGFLPPEREVGRAIPPGWQRLNAKDIDFGPSIVDLPGWEKMMRDGTRNVASMYADVTAIEVTLDAVIFDDGTLIGSDKGDLQKDFAAYVEAKQKLFRSVVAGLDAGQSMDQVFAPVKEATAVRASSLMVADDLSYYSMVAAQEILRLRARIGDEAVYNLFKQAIRKQPFVIHRREVNGAKGE